MPETLQKTVWGARGSSPRGASHLRTGLPNQDSLGAWCDKTRSRAVVVVSDGHGSARHFRSDTGSRLAVEASMSVLREVSLPIGEAEAHALSRPIVETWRNSVKAHLAEHPFEAADWEHVPEAEREQVRAAVTENPVVAYGATLLAVLASDADLLFLQLGDGDILCVGEDGATTRPMTEDNRLIANQTTSLCQNEAPENFRYARIHADGDTLPMLILISSDGYSNSFSSDEDFLQVGSDYLNLLRQFGAEKVEAQLEHILSEASRKGSGDDITLGMLNRLESVVDAPAPEPAVQSRSKSQPQAQATSQRESQRVPVDGAAPRLQQLLRRYQIALVVVILLAAAGAALAYWRPPAIAGLFHGASGRRAVGLRLPGGEQLTLKAGTVLSAAQLRLRPPFDGPVLEVAASDTGLLLRNRSGREWSAAAPGAAEPHRMGVHDSVPARNGERVFFGASQLLVISN